MDMNIYIIKLKLHDKVSVSKWNDDVIQKDHNYIQ